MKAFLRNKIFLGILLTTVTALAADTVLNTDRTKIGRKVSSGDKVLEFDNNSVSNPQISTTPGQDNLRVRTNRMQLGTGTAANQSLEFNTGASPAPAIRWNNTAAKIEFTNDGTNFKAIGSGSGSGAGINLIENSGFEDGTLGFTNTGGVVAVVTTGSNLLFGLQSVTFDASAAAQVFETQAITIPEILRGRNCLARVHYKGADANLIFEATDGSNVQLAQQVFSAFASVRPLTLNFPCPTSGSIKWRVRSTADATLVALDQVTLGEADNLSQVSQATFVGGIKYTPALNCIWNVASPGSFSNFPADTDCSAPTVTGSASAPATRIPGITFSSLAPGNYVFVITANTSNSSVAGLGRYTYYRISDGTNHSSSVVNYTDAANIVAQNMAPRPITINSTLSNVTFQIQAQTFTGATAQLFAGGDTADLEILVYRFPLSSEQAFRPDQVAWRVDANIAGGNPNLGTASVSSYTGMTHPSLTLTNNPGIGVIPAQIGCAGTTAPTGTTCTAADESVSVSWLQPTSGDVLACATMNAFLSLPTSSAAEQIFQIVETPNNAQTILQEGKGKLSRYFNTATIAGAQTTPFRVCGTFSFASAGQKTLRVFYEQNIESGSISNSTAIADALPNIGQRDIKWEITPLTQAVPMPVLVGGLLPGTPSTTERVVSATVNLNCSASPCSMDRSSGISSITRTAAGQYVANFSTAFAAFPTCVCNAGGAVGAICFRDALNSPTQFGFGTTQGSFARADASFEIKCVGPR
jgi:hypothetical protein